MEGNNQNLVEACIRQMTNFSHIEVNHILRNQNVVVDAITKATRECTTEFEDIKLPPLLLFEVLSVDVHRVPSAR